MNSFHARGAFDLVRHPDFQIDQDRAKRQRIEELLRQKHREFTEAGFWKKQAILKSIHRQADREFSLDYCLF